VATREGKELIGRRGRSRRDRLAGEKATDVLGEPERGLIAALAVLFERLGSDRLDLDGRRRTNGAQLLGLELAHAARGFVDARS